MAENSKIQWTNHTNNLWWGCSKVHTGCINCYAEEVSDRFDGKGLLWGPNKWRKPVKSFYKDLNKYQRIAEKTGVKQKVFVGSMMDIFESPRPLLFNGKMVENPTYTSELRSELFEKIEEGLYNGIIFLFLTKRPENIQHYIPENWQCGNIPGNIWFGASISDQPTADKFIDELRDFTPKGSNLFLSIEPQIGYISSIDLTDIKWVIQGGESGDNKRPFNINWAWYMRGWCDQWQVPYFFKQIDKIQPIPEHLMIREFPNF